MDASLLQIGSTLIKDNYLPAMFDCLSRGEGGSIIAAKEISKVFYLSNDRN